MAEDWHCFKCKQKMVKTRTDIGYMSYKLRFDTLKCPSCGVMYENEEMAKKIVEGQEIIENKAK